MLFSAHIGVHFYFGFYLCVFLMIASIGIYRSTARGWAKVPRWLINDYGSTALPSSYFGHRTLLRLSPSTRSPFSVLCPSDRPLPSLDRATKARIDRRRVGSSRSRRKSKPRAAAIRWHFAPIGSPWVVFERDSTENIPSTRRCRRRKWPRRIIILSSSVSARWSPLTFPFLLPQPAKIVSKESHVR